MVTNTPDVLNDEVADFTVGLLLATIPGCRRLTSMCGADAGPRAKFIHSAPPCAIVMSELSAWAASAARSPGAWTGLTSRSPIIPGVRADLRYPYYPDLQELARVADTLDLSFSLAAWRRWHAIHADIMTALGSDGILINVARGSVVDEAALIAALQAGTILPPALMCSRMSRMFRRRWWAWKMSCCCRISVPPRTTHANWWGIL